MASVGRGLRALPANFTRRTLGIIGWGRPHVFVYIDVTRIGMLVLVRLSRLRLDLSRASRSQMFAVRLLILC